MKDYRVELMTLKEIALAEKKTERGVRKDIAAGRFGPQLIRLGRSVRVRADEFSDWLQAGAPHRERWLAIRAAQQQTGGVR